MKARSDRKTVPDFIRRGIRQGLGVAGLVLCGYEVVEPFGESSKTADQWLTCFKWAAISLIVLTAPVLGKVTQVSFERTVGTLAGGFLGLVTVLLGREMMQASDQAFTALVSGLVGFGAVVAGHKLGLEYAGRLVAMTFILVVIGADGRADAFLVAITRCSGIILGVGVSVILASFVFPKSASHQAADNLASALDGLCRLCDLAWNSAYLGRPQAEDLSDEGFYMQLDHAEPEHQAAIGSASAKEAECEKVLLEIYNCLSKVDEFLPLARQERYMFTFRGKPMQELATSIRRVSRILWALHVTFQKGFDEEIISILQQRYPANTLSTLQSASLGSLTDIQEAFPDDTILSSANLKRFLTAVRDLISISNQHRCFIIGMLGLPTNIPARESELRLPKSHGAVKLNGTGLQDAWQSLSGDLDWAAEDSSRQAGTSALTDHNLGNGIKSTLSSNEGSQTNTPFFGDDPSEPLTVDKVEAFPLSAEGHITKIRWYSFQFLMQELSHDLEVMHRSAATVLKMLPNALAARHV